MGKTGARGWFRSFVPVLLITVIQMRLVWMQLRDYTIYTGPRSESAEVLTTGSQSSLCRLTPVPSQRPESQFVSQWLAPPGLRWLFSSTCAKNPRDFAKNLVRFNQWTFVGTIGVLALAARIMTSSWTLALVTAATLLSRGVLLTALGQIEGQHQIMFVCALWFCALAHFLRTGSALTFVIAAAAAAIGGVFEPGLSVLMLSLVALLIVGMIVRGFAKTGPYLSPSFAPPRRSMQKVYGPPKMEQNTAGTSAREIGEKGETLKTAATTSSLGMDPLLWRWIKFVRELVGLDVAIRPDSAETPPLKKRYSRGGAFQPIEVPFLFWAFPDPQLEGRSRFFNIAAGTLFCTGMAVVIQCSAYWWMASHGGGTMDPAAFFGQAGHVLRTAFVEGFPPHVFIGWFEELTRPLDMHLYLSLAALLVAAAQRLGTGLSGFSEASWLALIALTFLIGVGVWLDAGDMMVVSTGVGRIPAVIAVRPVFLWFQPIILTMGIVAALHLLRVSDLRLAPRKFPTPLQPKNG